MGDDGQAGRAEELRALHGGVALLVLPNAWDAASARLFEEAGFPAVATSSAAIAFAAGLPDGERIALDDALKAIARIVRAVRVPVTADFEAGYGATPGQVAANVRALLAIGAVGANLEDGTGNPVVPLVDVELHAARVAAAREAGRAAGVPLVINARTDVYLDAVGPPESRFEVAVERLRAYHRAGAGSLFAPGVTDAATIARLVTALPGPLNVLAGAGSPPLGELRALGVRRVSFGSSIMRATLGRVRRIALELRATGTYASLLEDAIPYAELDRLFRRG